MPELNVTYKSGKAFTVKARNHEFITDQTLDNDGEDLGPTPVEFFIASMAGCAGLFASIYLKRNDLDTSKLTVNATWDYEKNPSRVGSINMVVESGLELSSEQIEKMHKMVEGCTIHKTLLLTPQINITCN